MEYSMKILILCTGNSCRSQMAEGYIRNFRPEIEVYSAGTFPATRVHPLAVKVMNEDGIDISAATSTDEEVLAFFRRVGDEIKYNFEEFLINIETEK
jgi:protein-tyrosine-phosphatase